MVSLLEVNHFAGINKMVYAPALPSRTLIRRPGFLFSQGCTRPFQRSSDLQGNYYLLRKR